MPSNDRKIKLQVVILAYKMWILVLQIVLSVGRLCEQVKGKFDPSFPQCDLQGDSFEADFY